MTQIDTRPLYKFITDYKNGDGKDYHQCFAIVGETELLELMQDDSTLYEYEHLEITDIQRHVWQAVSELPERLRNVILRYYFGGESLGDIAKTEGVSVSEIQRRKNNGLNQLRRCRQPIFSTVNIK